MAYDNQMGYTRDPLSERLVFLYVRLRHYSSDQPIPELEENRLHLLPSEV